MLPGRFTSWKGQSVLIKALQILGRQDVCCVLVGGDQGRGNYRAELEAHVHACGLGPVVRLADRCTDMAAAYMLADVVVSASTRPEGFGRVAVEAQAMGRPIIAYARGGVLETVIPDRQTWKPETGIPEPLTANPSGLFFYEQTPEALISAVRHFESIENGFDPDSIRKHAVGFDKCVFSDRIYHFIEDRLQNHRC